MINNDKLFELSIESRIYNEYSAPRWFSDKVEEFKNKVKPYVFKDYLRIYNDKPSENPPDGYKGSKAFLYSMHAKSESSRKGYFLTDWVRIFLHNFQTDMHFKNKIYKTSVPDEIINEYKKLFSKPFYKMARKNFILWKTGDK